MGVRFPSVQSNTVANALPASNLETVICITPPLTLPLDSALVLLFWTAVVNIGTGTTALQFRLRRGTTTAGTQVNAALQQQTVVAGNFNTASGAYFDTPGAVGGQQYCLTVIQSAATGAGLLNDVSLLAFAL